MNKDTRKELSVFRARIEQVHSDLETVRDSEQDKYDNMPESLQQGEAGEKMSSAIDALNEAVDALDTAMSAIDTAGE